MLVTTSATEILAAAFELIRDKGDLSPNDIASPVVLEKLVKQSP